MEERLFELILAEARLNDVCANKLNHVLDELKKQKRINRRQRITNILLTALVCVCINEVNALYKRVKEKTEKKGE